MIELSDWHLFPDSLRGGVLCVGNFDGVHVGHARMLQTGRDKARESEVPFTVMTFEPHPAVILRPDAVRLPLTTLEQRREILSGFGPDALVVLPTTREFLSMTAEAFLTDVVQGRLGATSVVEGATFTFGRGAKGDTEMLRRCGTGMGFQTTIVPTAEVGLSDRTIVSVSSTLVRWLAERGRVKDVSVCLGRPLALRGPVVEGAKRGRTIGFPTANIAVRQMLPAAGIYGGTARVGSQSYRAAISVGTNPTFGGTSSTVEAYLLDFSGDLYGQIMDLEFDRWVRDMEKFAGVEALVRQIEKDVEQVRRGA